MLSPAVQLGRVGSRLTTGTVPKTAPEPGEKRPARASSRRCAKSLHGVVPLRNDARRDQVDEDYRLHLVWKAIPPGELSAGIDPSVGRSAVGLALQLAQEKLPVLRG